jgi:PAS domain S-box-containing protein
MKFLIFLICLSLSLFSHDTEHLNSEEKEFIKKHPVINISIKENWATYTYIKDGVPKGYIVDYLGLISSRLDIEFKFNIRNNNLLEKIRSNEAIIIPLNSSSKNYKNSLSYTEPFFKTKSSIITTGKSIKSFEDFSNKLIGVSKGLASTIYLKKHYPDAIYKEYDSSAEKLEDLAYGKLDAAVEYFMTANYIKQKFLFNNLNVMKQLYSDESSLNIGIGVKKEWETFKNILNKTIHNISQDELNQLNKKWIELKKTKINLSKEEENFLLENPVFKTRVAKAYAPFSFVENDVPKGYAVDLSKLLAERLDIKLEFVKDQSWNDSLDALKSLDLDIIPMMKKTPAREKFALLKNPVLDNYVGIATIRGKIKDVSLKNLVGKRVAVLKNYWFVENLDKYYSELKTITYTDDLQALKDLSENKVDAIISTEPVMKYLIKNNSLANITVKALINNKYFTKSPGYFGIRKDWEILTSIFEKALNSLDKEDVEKIKVKWFGSLSTFSNPFILNFNNEELLYLQKKEEIKICVGPKWMPYQEFNNGKHNGIVSEYFKLFAKVIPLPIKLVETSSWDQSKGLLENKSCDIVSLFIKNAENYSNINLSKTYMNIPLVLATKFDKPYVSSFKDVLKYKIGILKGHSYIRYFKDIYPSLQLVEVNDLKTGMDMVNEGEIYGFVDSLAVIGYFIQKEYIGSIKIAGEVNENLKLSVLVRNDEPILKNIFNKAIVSLTESDHRTILNKWVSVVYDKGIDYSLIWKILFAIFLLLSFLIYRQYLLKKQNLLLLQSQNTLKDINEEFEHLINSTIEAIFLWKNGKCININNSAIKLFGYKNKKELIGIDSFDIVSVDSHTIIQKHLNENINTSFEITAIKKDGTTFPVLVKTHNFMQKNEKIDVSAIVDLSELKYKERLLTEQTKMVAIGDMLGNIAHHWRQPLSIISTAASGIQLQKDNNLLSDEILDKTMETIVQNTNVLSNTINDFSNFIKDGNSMHKFNLKEHMQRNLTIFASMLTSENIKVIINIDSSIFISAYENELSQAIMNIIGNSRDAFIEQKIDERFIFIDSFCKEEKINISIQDNAGGISDEILAKIFEPYFTSKHNSQGTGMGLYITNKIIRDTLKGTISVKNKEYIYKDNTYTGALFEISL